MGVINILPEKLNLDQAVNIFIFKKDIDLQYGINYRFIPLFNYNEYKIYGVEYQKETVDKNFDKIKRYVIRYVNKEKYNDPNLF